MRSRLSIDYSHEFELTLSASVSPGSPEVRDVESPMCGPASGPEVDDVRLELTREQVDAIRRAKYRFPHPDGAGVRMYDATPPCATLTAEQVAEFALAFLRALDPEFATSDRVDEAFIEALGTERDAREAAEDDAAEARAEDRRMHPEDYRDE